MGKDLSKLQIRSLVLSVIDEYLTAEKIGLVKHRELIDSLIEIDDKKTVLETFIKELISSHDKTRENIIYSILGEISNLEESEGLVWNYINDSALPDETKRVLFLYLKSLGAQINSNIINQYMEEPENLAKEDVKEIFQDALNNPDLQVDCLDFIFSLDKKEQLDAIQILSEEAKDAGAVSILCKYLKATNILEIKKKLVEILINTNSYDAVEALKFTLESTTDNELKRLILKGLNDLQTNGININDEEKVHRSEKLLCATSKPYKCFLSQIDGWGNQGIVFSRINDKQQIDLFSTVINISDGIIDCFGLKEVSPHEFLKVVERFRVNSTVVPASPEYIKHKLIKAEKINKEKEFPIAYEYICWKSYIYDIKPEKQDNDALLEYEYDEITLKDHSLLYRTEDFDSWFFEYQDNKDVDEIIEFVTKNYDKTEKFCNEIDSLIKEKIPTIFDDEAAERISDMLIEAGLVFKFNNQYNLVNICANISKIIKNSTLENRGEIRFLNDFVRRSVLQYVANLVAEKEEEKPKAPATIFDRNKEEDTTPKMKPDKAFELLKQLELQWSKE